MANKYELRRRALKESGGRVETRGAARRDGRGELGPQDYTPPPPMDRVALTAALCLGLVVLVTALYVQTARHDFTVCDDNVYIYEKPQIRTGLTWESVKWAFMDAHEGNWHPLTWISHMVDWQLFSHGTWEPENQIYKESWPGGHHLVNMGLHCANAVLLFLALRLMTGTLWPSFVVAVLFAVHPLRVESVAWAAERKDVLCGLFWMATLLSYALYARRPPLSRSSSEEAIGTILLYALVNVFMGLGLMAKSMIVTLPCVLILLDLWPLGRWKRALWPYGDTEGDIDFGRGLLLLLEKVPLFGMAVADSLVTVYGQAKGVALNSFEGLPLGVRLLNAVESCGEYLRQTFWPTGMAPFYAHPHMIPNGWTHEFYVKFWIYSMLLLAITLAAAWNIFRRPYLAVGWLWYLGALMPVIGIIQVGTQARADRYTYLPMIGVYLMVAWLLKEVADRWPQLRSALAGGGLVLLLALSAVTFRQVGLWVNSYVLFKNASGIADEDYFGYTKDGKVDLEKAMKVAQMSAKTEGNYFAFNHIGIAYDKDGKELMRTDMKAGQEAFDRSAAAFQATLAIKPDYDFGNNNLGVYFARPGKSHDAKAAEKFFRQAIAVNQRYADAYNNLGIVLAEQGRALRAEGKLNQALAKLEDSAEQHARGLSVRPDRASDHNNLCGVFLEMSRVHKDAAAKARAAGETAKAADEDRLQNISLNNALQQDTIALQCDRNFVGAWQTRVEILHAQKDMKHVVEALQRIVEIDPKSQEAVQGLNGLMTYYNEQKDPEKALEYLDETGKRFVQAIAGRPVTVETVNMPYCLAACYMNLKQPEKALQWLDQTENFVKLAFAGRPNSMELVQIRFRVGLLCLELKRPDKALGWLNQVLAVEAQLPGQFRAEVHNARGAAYDLKGDLAAAKAEYELVLQLAPNSPRVQERLNFINGELAKPPK
jgi:tetratricopeptide (TPR) repeat protein